MHMCQSVKKTPPSVPVPHKTLPIKPMLEQTCCQNTLQSLKPGTNVPISRAVYLWCILGPCLVHYSESQKLVHWRLENDIQAFTKICNNNKCLNGSFPFRTELLKDWFSIYIARIWKSNALLDETDLNAKIKNKFLQKSGGYFDFSLILHAFVSLHSTLSVFVTFNCFHG